MSEPILEAVDLCKTYRLGRVDVPVLKGVSLSVREGECVAVLGASGSGKSTLLHLLGGLDRPDAEGGSGGGTGGNYVKFRGRSLAGFSAPRLDEYRCASVGFVFQFYHLLPELNVLQNVCLPAMIRHGRLGYMAKRTAVEAKATELVGAFGLSARIRHRPAELSGGERQRVAIARALCNGPPVLLADEPTGNLDRKTGSAILDLIFAQRARDGLTLVMVTHDQEVASRADRVVHLVDGQLNGN